MLTTKQWQLYELLKTQPDHWFTQEEICNAIPEYHYKNDTRNHCVEIGTDRVIINEDVTIDKIIVTKKHKFKIATPEEYEEERNYHIRKLKGQVAQIKAMDLKFNRDGQCKLFNELLNELKPTNEQCHETFIKEEQ